MIIMVTLVRDHRNELLEVTLVPMIITLALSIITAIPMKLPKRAGFCPNIRPFRS